jgi:hypothetical protein
MCINDDDEEDEKIANFSRLLLIRSLDGEREKERKV